ncbi:MAG: transposase [Gammaproteobacteria bacterium]|nr:transposase [Gammaproteobacteria bacterium]
MDFIQPASPQQNAYIERYYRTVRLSLCWKALLFN